MNSKSENRSSAPQQKNSALESLMRKSSEALQNLEMLPYDVQVYAIPVEQRAQELELLRAASEFQPELYRMLRELATRRELAGHVAEIMKLNTSMTEDTMDAMKTEVEGMNARFGSLVSQDGKARERFISECTSALRQNSLRIEQITDGLRRKVLRYMLGSAAIAATLSAMVCWVFCRLAG